MSFEQPTQPESEPRRLNLSTPTVKPIITYILMGILVLVFIFQNISTLILGYDILFILFGKINDFILLGQFWRLITPAFLHSSILHIAFNMYALFILGRRIESTYGHWRFLLLFSLSAFGGNVLSFVLSTANSLGSSTAVFGLLAAEGIFIWNNRKLFGQRANAMLGNILFILVINLVIGFTPGTNIDYWGHLGGLLAGFLFASIGGPKWKVEGVPPFMSLEDSRSKSEVWIATVIVLIGFIIMAAIPFFNR